MKRFTITLILTLATCIQLRAQDPRGMIGISFGPAFPVGDLSSKNISNKSAGWANAGITNDISVQYRIGKGNFGICGKLRGQTHLTDAQAFANELARTDPNNIWSVQSSSWEMSGILLGGYVTFPVAPKVRFENRLLIGVMTARCPEFTTFQGLGNKATWAKYSSATSTGVSYSLGAGFRFDVSKRLCISSDIDLWNATMDYSGVDYCNSGGELYTVKWKQNLRTVNIHLGIAIKI